MKHVLVIEMSATLRNVISKHLKERYVLHHALNYQDGLDKLTHARHQGTPFDMVIFHWPVVASSATDELLFLFQEADFQKLALLVLVHESNASDMDWISMRPHSALLNWENHRDIRASVESLEASLEAQRKTSPPQIMHPEESVTVLVVDDSPTARTKFRRLLEQNGYTILVAGSAQEALKVAHKNAIDIAIIDYFMPNGNGDWLCGEFKKDPATSSIICAILTGTYLDQVITSSLNAGATECMFKNEANELFIARVEAMRRNVLNVRRIERERQHLDNILESVGDGVYGIDAEGKICFMNPSAKRLLGFSETEELIGWRPQGLFHSSGNDEITLAHGGRRADDKSAEEEKHSHSYETEFTRQDGSTIQVELTIRPFSLAGESQGAVVAFRDITVRKLLEDELKWQANHDMLTKLYNRNYFEESLAAELQRCHVQNITSTLLYLDLDRFKYINDTLGHAAGDQLLIQLSALLDARIRKNDLLARLGGDEFAIIFRDLSPEQSFTIAEELRTTLAAYPFFLEGKPYQVNCTIGIAPISADVLNGSDALANADIACHIAKGKGRNQSHIFEGDSDNRASVDVEISWSSRLVNAIKLNQFQLYAQPIVALADIDINSLNEGSGSLWGREQLRQMDRTIFEILLRLPDSRHRSISPHAFLPTAERFSLMADIDQWVIGHALEKLAALHARGLKTAFSINISEQSLADRNLAAFISRELEQQCLPADKVMFEIAEVSSFANIEQTRAFTAELRERGCSVALDDFGSNHSSFAHLKNLPVDLIKIDGCYMQGIENDPTELAIVSSISTIAHSQGKRTIAEGVESLPALRKLYQSGVDYVQGYSIAQPQKLENLIAVYH